MATIGATPGPTAFSFRPATPGRIDGWPRIGHRRRPTPSSGGCATPRCPAPARGAAACGRLARPATPHPAQWWPRPGQPRAGAPPGRRPRADAAAASALARGALPARPGRDGRDDPDPAEPAAGRRRGARCGPGDRDVPADGLRPGSGSSAPAGASASGASAAELTEPAGGAFALTAKPRTWTQPRGATIHCPVKVTACVDLKAKITWLQHGSHDLPRPGPDAAGRRAPSGPRPAPSRSTRRPRSTTATPTAARCPTRSSGVTTGSPTTRAP